MTSLRKQLVDLLDLFPDLDFTASSAKASLGGSKASLGGESYERTIRTTLHALSRLGRVVRLGSGRYASLLDASGRPRPGVRVEEPRKAIPGAPTKVLELNSAELDQLKDALDSHIYWQLSSINYRRDGYVTGKGSDNPENTWAIKEARRLLQKLEGYSAAARG